MTAQDALKRFAQNTSLTGFNRLTSKEKPVQTVWATILCCVSLGSVYHLGQLIMSYHEYRVNTAFIIHRDALEFPDVTLCATSQISQLRYDRNRTRTSIETEKFSKEFWKVYWYYFRKNITKDANILKDFAAYGITNDFLTKGYNGTTTNYVAKIASLDHTINAHAQLWYAHYSSKIGRKIEDILISCRFGMRECSTGDFVELKHPHFLNCFTFQPTNRTVVDNESTSDLPKTLKLVLHREYGKRLAMTTYNRMSHMLGFYVSAHAPNSIPDRGKFILAETGYKTTIFVDAEAQAKVCRPGKACLIQPDPINVTSSGTTKGAAVYNYDPELCKKRQYQYKLARLCDCIDPGKPTPVELSYLFEDDKTCGYFPIHDVNSSSLRSVRTVLGGTNFSSVRTTFTWKNGTEEEFVDFVFNKYKLNERLRCFHDNQAMDAAVEQKCIEPCYGVSYVPQTVNRVKFPYSAVDAKDYVSHHLTDAIKTAKSQHKNWDVLEDLRQRFVNNTNNISFYRDTFQLVEIIPISPDLRVLEETMATTAMELLSSIGGMFGLWTGLCVIAVFEAVELVLNLMVSAVRPVKAKVKRRQRRVKIEV